MTEQTKGPHVLQAITLVMANLAKDGIGKTRKNQAQGYAFRGIDDVYNALAPLLANAGLVIVPRVLKRTCDTRETTKGGVLYNVVVEVEFTLSSAFDGSFLTCVSFGEAMDSGDKATNKAMSAAYKYMAMQVFCIPTEGDNDADATTPEPTKPDASKVKDYVNRVIGDLAGLQTMEELDAYTDKLHASGAWRKLTAEHADQAKRIQGTIAAKTEVLLEREPG